MFSQELEQYLKDLNVAFTKDNHNTYLVKSDYLLLTIKCKENKATITFRPNNRECSQKVLDKIQVSYNNLEEIKEYIEDN
jgi:uncharacterized lipoprotein YehR (DUF1307 family)